MKKENLKATGSEVQPLLYGSEETRKALGLTRRQLYHLVHRGLLKKHPAFRSLVFKKNEVEAFAKMDV